MAIVQDDLATLVLTLAVYLKICYISVSKRGTIMVDTTLKKTRNII